MNNNTTPLRQTREYRHAYEIIRDGLLQDAGIVYDILINDFHAVPLVTKEQYAQEAWEDAQNDVLATMTDLIDRCTGRLMLPIPTKEADSIYECYGMSFDTDKCDANAILDNYLTEVNRQAEEFVYGTTFRTFKDFRFRDILEDVDLDGRFANLFVAEQQLFFLKYAARIDEAGDHETARYIFEHVL